MMPWSHLEKVTTVSHVGWFVDVSQRSVEATLRTVEKPVAAAIVSDMHGGALAMGACSSRQHGRYGQPNQRQVRYADWRPCPVRASCPVRRRIWIFRSICGPIAEQPLH